MKTPKIWILILIAQNAGLFHSNIILTVPKNVCEMTSSYICTITELGLVFKLTVVKATYDSNDK